MDINKVEEEIIKLREEKQSCSQATLLGIARTCTDGTMPEEKMLKAMAAGLRGGIGGTRDEGTCGALTAAVVALGLLHPEDNMKSLKLSRQLYEDFKKRFGTVICGNMTRESGTARCTECCVYAGRKVCELCNEL